MQRIASCTCGQLNAQCLGEPVRISICHCLDCQRRTGSAFGVQATYREADVILTGSPSAYTRHGDEGHWVTTYFCPTCGSTAWYRIERRPGMVSVPVGGFADPVFPEPRVSVYEQRKHPWIELQPQEPLTRED